MKTNSTFTKEIVCWSSDLDLTDSSKPRLKIVPDEKQYYAIVWDTGTVYFYDEDKADYLIEFGGDI